MLFAVPLDLTKLATVGEPVAVVEGVRRAAPGTTGAVHYAVSDAGTLVYLQGPVSTAGAAMQTRAVRSHGRRRAPQCAARSIQPSAHLPDGTQVAIGAADAKEAQVWNLRPLEVERRAPATFGEAMCRQSGRPTVSA